MNRIWALVERDLRKFMRSPTLILVSMIMPIVQLVVLGYAFGGKIHDLRVAVVNQDHGMPTVKLREMCGAIAANARTFETVDYTDLQTAMRDLRDGRVNGVLNFPPDYSRRVLAKDAPQVALIEDNTDNFAVDALEAEFSDIVGDLQSRWRPAARPQRCHTLGGGTLSVRSLYPISPGGFYCHGDLRFRNDRRRYYLYR